ncbi:unnamed protein product, partial [Prorocentrum cordatum]
GGAPRGGGRRRAGAALRGRGGAVGPGGRAGAGHREERVARRGKGDSGFRRILSALWQMSRPQNIPMSMVLVIAGACGARGLSWLALPAVRWQVLLCMLLTVMVTTSSCMVNDYFDYVAGVDGEESQGDRPLVKGDITPLEAKRALKWFYFAIILAICVVESRSLRIYVLFNALLTYVYTQELKPRGFLYKNGCVAIVISLAIGLGAAAAQVDAGTALAAGIVQVWPAMAATFCGIFAREVIMDVTDVEGD